MRPVLLLGPRCPLVKTGAILMLLLHMAMLAQASGSTRTAGDVRADIARLLERVQVHRHDADRGASFDWQAAGIEVAALAESMPQSDDVDLRSLAISVFEGIRKHVPNAEADLVARLSGSPNIMIREVAAAGAELASARETPMTMEFTSIDGRRVDLSDLRGKVVLIDFWAVTWCAACKVQLPLLKDVYARYHTQGFEVIGITCETKESDREAVLKFVEKSEIRWPQYFDGMGMQNEFARRFGFIGIPQYFLLDRDGLLIEHTSGSGGLANLEAVVRKQLGLPPLEPTDDQKKLGARRRK